MLHSQTIPKVKICGLRRAEDVRDVARAGADELGFHVGLTGGRSPLDQDEATNLIKEIPTGARAVVVTSFTEPKQLIQLGTTGATILQLYGDVKPETIAQVKKALPYMEIWKVINVAGSASLDEVKRYEGVADAVVLDKAQNAIVRGGSGQLVDWNVAREIAFGLSIPVILAGGLTPDNVAEAIRTVKPYGVDVNSGVTNPDGSKDMEKVTAFISAAKSAK